MMFFLFFKLMFVIAGFALYFLPTLIASSRASRSQGGVFVLNLLLGWTFIGWFVALIWAVTSERSYRYYHGY